MAVTNPPVFIQAGSHPAEDVRRLFAWLTNDDEGVRAASELAVTEKGTPDMSVDVSAGRIFIKGTESSFQGTYFCESRATENLAIAAADATNPRIDLVVAKVEDSAESGATDAWSLAVVTGTPAGSPSAPAAPANSVTLATVAVAALASSIVDANITQSTPLIVVVDDDSHSHTDTTITGTLSNDTTGNAATADAVDVVGSTSDTSTYPLLATTTGSGSRTPVIDASLSYNASSNVLNVGEVQATGEVGGGSLDINGAGDVSGTLTVGALTASGTVTGDALAVSGAGWTDYTPTLFQSGSISTSYNNSAYRVLGDWVEVVFHISTSSAGIGGYPLRLSIPTGTMSTTRRAEGIARWTNTTTNIIASIDYYDSNEVSFQAHGDTGDYDTALASGQIIMGKFSYLKN